MRNGSRLLGMALVALALGAPARVEAQQHQDLVDVARSAGSFQTLLAAVDAAGLTHTLADGGPFTVFAPTDDAFDALPDGTVEALLRPENRDRLAAILTYHVVPGRVTAAEASRLTGAETVNGQRVSISRQGAGLRIDDAAVITADVSASNGVIHVIDAVLMPGASAAASAAAADWIGRAIALGAPLFNSGDAEACADVYMVTASAIVRMGGQLSPDVVERLERSLREAEHESDARERAWIMRRGLDAAAAMLSEGHGDAGQARSMRSAPSRSSART